MEKSLEDFVNTCLLNKLSKEYHTNDYHPEFTERNLKLKNNFYELKTLLENDEFVSQQEIVSNVLPHIIILYVELQSEGPWNSQDFKLEEYSSKLNQIFLNKHSINLNEILHCDHEDSQVILDKCIKELHRKMTLDDFRKYPCLIEVYCTLVKNIKKKIKVNPVTVLPVALLLIEDYIPANKIKGLQCCTAIFQCLSVADITAGNYYEVVYSSLKKNIVEKDVEITKVLFPCILEFLKIVPGDIKKKKLDDIFSSVIEELHTESNLYRKANCFNFTTKIIQMHGIHCVKKKLFKDIICDSIDICSNESVSAILLPHVLECFRTWIKYCWCIWKLSSDHKMLSSLFKLLYLTHDENTKLEIENMILTLITLCTKEEQVNVLTNLQEPFKCSNQDFLLRLEDIKNQIH